MVERSVANFYFKINSGTYEARRTINLSLESKQEGEVISGSVVEV